MIRRRFSKPNNHPWPRCGACFHRTDPVDMCRQPLVMIRCRLAASAVLNTAHLAVGMGRPDRPALSLLNQPAGPIASEGVPSPAATEAHVTPGEGDMNCRTVDSTDQVAELLAQGAGRRKLAVDLGVSEHQARSAVAFAERTRPMNLRRPGQESPEEPLAGSTSPRWRKGRTSDTQASATQTGSGRRDRLLPRGEEPPSRLPLARLRRAALKVLRAAIHWTR
jgi:hypothetical protein